jgi:large subunit ribosomal protein L10
VNREEKVAEVADLNDKFAKAKIAIVADYKGLTVPVLQELRHNLRRNDAEFRVAKNTLLIRAVEDTAFKGLQEHFVGTTAVTVSYGDPVTPAKIISDFCKDHPELKIRTGLLDGKLLSTDDITALSKLPSKEVLLSQMLSVMNAVPTGLVQVLSGVPRTFLYALQAIKEQKEQAAN